MAAAAATQAQAQVQVPQPKPTRRRQEIPVRGVAGRNPRLIPKRGRVLRNAIRVIFSSCLPCLKPVPDSRNPP